MENENADRNKIQDYRREVRHTCSVLGWSLVALALLTQLFGILFSFVTSGGHLLAYALVLPVMSVIMRQVPEVIPEKKKMRLRKFIMFFVLTMGSGYVLNLAGNLMNGIAAIATGRDMYNMNPVNSLYEQMNFMTVLYVTILGPIIEEYIFRWKLLNRLRPLGEKAAILFSAVMFGLMHGNLAQMLYATAIGVVLGYIAVKTGRLKYNCILHIMINSYSTLLVLLLAIGGGSFAFFIILVIAPLIMLGMIIASVVIFCVNVKKTRLLPGNWPEGIEYRDFSSAMYWNPGTVTFIVLSLLMAGFYLFVA